MKPPTHNLTSAFVVLAILNTATLFAQESDSSPSAGHAPEKHIAKSDAENTTPTLNMKQLAARLRATKALGFFTKLRLKNQIDGFLDQIRQFHVGEKGLKLTRLRKQYNELHLEIITLLRDQDVELYIELTASQETLWQQLIEPTLPAMESEARAGSLR